MIKSTGIIKYIQKKGPQTTLELFNQFEAKIRKAAPGIEDESRLLAALFNELIIEGDIIKTPDNKWSLKSIQDEEVLYEKELSKEVNLAIEEKTVEVQLTKVDE